VSAARALLEFTEQTFELPRDLICELMSFVADVCLLEIFANSIDPNRITHFTCTHWAVTRAIVAGLESRTSK